MNATPQAFFENLRTRQQADHAELQRKYDRFAMMRLVAFIVLLILVILAFSAGFFYGLPMFLVFVAIAYALVRRHNAIKRAAELAATRATIADRELGALQHDFRVFDGGEEFTDPAHPYAVDLDVFGSHSLFQFINRTVTAPGKRRLADWLLAPQTEQVRARTQVQGTELAARPEWCVEFRTLGEGIEDSLDQQTRLRQWLTRPPVINGGKVDRVFMLLAPLFTLGFLIAAFTVSPWFAAVGFLTPNVLLYRKYAEAIATEHAYTAAMGKLLNQYADLLRQLNEPESPVASVTSAEPALRKLAYHVGQLDVRYNPFSILLELGGLWSANKVWKLDRWRETYRDDLPAWLNTIAEVDAWVSLGTLRFNRPDWTDPEFTTEPTLRATALGHPLLNPLTRITNDIDMRTDGHIHLVTGSNMAGKSTWLRTVGINLVLAQAGAPVCARHLRQRPLQVWTSMRTQDDLSEATSSFYAELKRLQAIIGAVSKKEHIFFLLDEILKGTNSRDRHTGSRALIRQLIRDKGAGIIATHDLELAALEDEPGSHVENYAMEVQTRGDDLVFDYKLHPGVCTSFNATALMARMGIAIPEEEIRLYHD